MRAHEYNPQQPHIVKPHTLWIHASIPILESLVVPHFPTVAPHLQQVRTYPHISVLLVVVLCIMCAGRFHLLELTAIILYIVYISSGLSKSQGSSWKGVTVRLNQERVDKRRCRSYTSCGMKNTITITVARAKLFHIGLKRVTIEYSCIHT